MQLKGESTANHEKNNEASTKDLVETRKQETQQSANKILSMQRYEQFMVM